MKLASGPERRSVGLTEVATEAGVSVVTVSRALNSPDLVAPKTRAAIEAAMRRLGWVPNLAARSLVSNRSQLVAVCVPTLVDSVFAEAVQALNESLSAAGLHLAVGDTGYSPIREKELVIAMLGRRPDAVVLTGTAHAPGLASLLRRQRIPVVETWNLTDRPIDMLVGFSNGGASRRITQHLIAQGYRRLAYVGRPVAGNDRATSRRDGFLAALRSAGLAADPALIVETETGMTAGAESIRRLLALARPPDAVLYSGDNTAAGAMLACLNDGVRVPHDVAVAGLGDLEIARLLPGGLTTIAFRAAAIGAETGRLIRERLSGERPHPIVDVGFELVPRGST